MSNQPRCPHDIPIIGDRREEDKQRQCKECIKPLLVHIWITHKTIDLVEELKSTWKPEPETVGMALSSYISFLLGFAQSVGMSKKQLTELISEVEAVYKERN